ncbi:MAG: 23S rRNA (guanosine(2251)-2'-O)-methyltransferase RlmB [Candidatus Paceibacterota bacterium]|jgi:23S rRNA (guanosine2251-2'-O)-methyltransferase
MMQSRTFIYGKHALEEALNNTPEIVQEVFFTHQFEDNFLRTLVKKRGIKATQLMPNKFPHGADEDSVHQGVIAKISVDKLVLNYKEFIDNLPITIDTSLIILGEIQDPQNVGAVIRSAAAFGVAGVLIPEHNQAPITGAVVKVSAGMAFRIPLVIAPNINNVARDLKDKGFWIYGLEGESRDSIAREEFDTPTVFILGNEAHGIRAKTRDVCDKLLTIPTNAQCESLNAAASAAVALYAWSLKHPKALRVKGV